jgi:hypothetical protein
VARRLCCLLLFVLGMCLLRRRTLRGGSEERAAPPSGSAHHSFDLLLLIINVLVFQLLATSFGLIRSLIARYMYCTGQPRPSQSRQELSRAAAAQAVAAAKEVGVATHRNARITVSALPQCALSDEEQSGVSSRVSFAPSVASPSERRELSREAAKPLQTATWPEQRNTRGMEASRRRPGLARADSRAGSGRIPILPPLLKRLTTRKLELVPYVIDRKQANVDELLERHAADIAGLRADLEDEPLLSAATHDDLWLLRFILSKGRTAEAAENIRATLAYREKNSALLERAAAGEAHPRHEVFSRLSCQATMPHPTLLDEQVVYSLAGRAKVKQLMKLDHPPGSLLEWMMYEKEMLYRANDRATRLSRRLVKQVLILDFNGMSIFGSDSRFMSVVGQASKLSSQYYPQLQAVTFIINAPGWMGTTWSLASKFMGPHSLAKTRFASAADCRSLFEPAHLPDTLGGEVESGLGPVNLFESEAQRERHLFGRRYTMSMTAAEHKLKASQLKPPVPKHSHTSPKNRSRSPSLPPSRARRA